MAKDKAGIPGTGFDSYNIPLYDYCKKNKVQIIVLCVFVILVYYAKLICPETSFDTDMYIQNPDELYRWSVGLDRTGLVIFHSLFGNYNIIPGYTNLMFVLGTVVYSVIWMRLFYMLGSNKNQYHIEWLLPVVFFSSFSILEVVNYQMHSITISVAIGLVGYGLTMAWRWIFTGKLQHAVLAVICYGLAFCTYQSAAFLCVAGSVAAFLCFFLERDDSFKDSFKRILALIVFFVAGILLFSLINVIGGLIFQPEISPYLMEKVHWMYEPFMSAASQTLKQCAIILYGYLRISDFRFFSLLFSLVFFFVTCCVFMIRGRLFNGSSTGDSRKNKIKHYLCLFILFGIIFLTAFLPVIFAGGRVVYRSQWTVPFVAAYLIQQTVNMILGLEFFKDNRKRFMAANLVVMQVLFFSAVPYANRLYYTENFVRQQDHLLTYSIAEEVNRLPDVSEDDALVIVGTKSYPMSPNMVKGEQLGWSFYERGEDEYARAYWASLGYKYKAPTPEERTKALEAAESMPSWPKEGSVDKKDNLIIVKVG